VGSIEELVFLYIFLPMHVNLQAGKSRSFQTRSPSADELRILSIDKDKMLRFIAIRMHGAVNLHHIL
jgi:hypothetical protein